MGEGGDIADDEIVDCKIEFRFLDKDRKFSEPSGPTTIVQRQVRMSREELNQVVPAPPAFSGQENDQEEFIPQTVTGLDIPVPITETGHTSPGVIPEEGSIYFDAHEASAKNANRREEYSGHSRHPSKNDEITSKNDDSFKTAIREDEPEGRRDELKQKQKSIENNILGSVDIIKLKENEHINQYDSAALPPEASQYESAYQDIGKDEDDNLPISEGRRSMHCLVDDMYDDSEKRKPSVIRVQDLTSAFQMQALGNKSRPMTASPKSTPPNSERRSLSSRQRRSCENLLETSDMSSRSTTTTTPRPTDLRSRTSTSPEVYIQQKYRKSPMPSEDISPRSRIPVATRNRSNKGSETPDEQELIYTSTPNIAAANNRGSRYENAERKIPLGLVDIAMSPQGNDDDSLSTRSLFSDRKNSRSSRILSLGRENEKEEEGNGYQRTISQEDMAKDFADLTPALRKRRGVEKYITDESQLNLRFQRRRTRPMSDVNPPPQALLNSRTRTER